MIEKSFNVKAKTVEQLHMFESFINFIDTCCRAGASRELTVYVDGDGDLELLFDDDLTCPFSDFEKGYGEIRFDENDEPYYWDLG